MTSNCHFLECGQCRAKLTAASNICFYIKDDKNVHMSVKSEREYVVRNEGKLCFEKPDTGSSEALDSATGTSSKRKKKKQDIEFLKCVQCSNKVGSVLPYGPQNAKFVALSKDSLRLCGVGPFPKKKGKSGIKLWQVFRSKPEWLMIDHRDDFNFRQVGSDGSKKVGEKHNSSIENDDASKDIYPLVFPDETTAARCAASANNQTSLKTSDDAPDDEAKENESNGEEEQEIERLYGWQSLDILTTPRSYQIESYLEALHRDLIIVLPTGMGKTLIATMVLRKLQSLNPNRMSLFIVDRIPLVFQQGAYIRNQTRGVLRVCMLCGENKTPLHVRHLKEGVYDVLVITAGALLNMVQREELDIVSMFSCVIFDECHHATGYHVYAQLLEKLKLSARLSPSGDGSKRRVCPRVIGLTASPISSNNMTTAKRRLDELCEIFSLIQQRYIPTSVFTPDIPSIYKNFVSVEHVEIERPSHYKNCACWIIVQMEEFRTLVNSYSKMLAAPSSGSEDMMFLESWITGCYNGVVFDEDVFDTFLTSSSLGRVRGSINALQDYIFEMESSFLCHRQQDSCDDVASSLISSGNSKDDTMQFLNECLRILKSLLGALEFLDIFGTSFVSRVISDIFEDGMLQDEEVWTQEFPASLSNACKSLKKEIPAYQQSNNTSPRLKRLEHELRKVASLGDKRSRVLVLVHSRVVAHELTEHINSIDCLRDAFRAEKVVGHGGFDGMAWEGEQEEAIRKFRLDDDDNHSSRLLVATSVLEEGLDVAECDLVVQLQGVKSSTSFIQSRGRARRMKNSRMLIFSTKRDFSRLVKVRDQESVMKLVVKQKSVRSLHLEQIEKELMAFYNGRTDSFRGEEIGISSSYKHNAKSKDWQLGDDKTIIFNLWALPGEKPEHDEEIFRGLLQESIESCGLTQFYITNIASIQSGSIEAIFDGAIGYMVGFSFASPVQNQSEASSPNVLSREWNYCVNGNLVWAQQHITPVNHTDYREPKDQKYKSNEVHYFSLGRWLDPNTFKQRAVSGHGELENIELRSIEFKQKEGMWIEFFYRGSTIGIEIPHASIFDFVLLDNCEDYNIRLFVPLRTTPLMYEMEFRPTGPEWNRESDPMRFPFLVEFAKNNVICVSMNNASRHVSQNSHLAVPLFETKVHIVDAMDGGNLDVPLHESCFLSPNGARGVAGHGTFPPSLFGVDHDKIRDIQWMVLSVFSQQLGCLTDNAKKNIWEFVFNIVAVCAEPSIVRFASDKLEEHSSQCSVSSSGPNLMELSWLYFALNQCMNLSYWADVEQSLKSCFSSFQTLEAECQISDSHQSIACDVIYSSPKKNQFKSYRLVCTPTRMIYLPPLLVGGSRLYRTYGSEPFVSVSFRDEQYQRLCGSNLMNVVHEAVSRGISIPGRSLVFFGSSNRQLREQQLLFIDTDLLPTSSMKDSKIDTTSKNHVKLLHGSIINIPATNKFTAPQFLSRLALYCTSDTPTLCVSEKDVASHPDLLCTTDGSALTDGAGAICRSLANHVCKYLKLSKTPAALQIRWRGVKGILVVVDDDSPLLRAKTNRNTSGTNHAKMMIRPSMTKCKTGIIDDGRLCVVDYSRIMPLHLNREIITLLCSIKPELFDPYPALSRLMEKALEKEADIFANAERGLSSVRGKLNKPTLRYFENFGQFTDLLKDPVWTDILDAQYRMSIREIVGKTRIPVERGLQVIGIPDPVGVLKDGEIFILIDEKSMWIHDDGSPLQDNEKEKNTPSAPWVLECENVVVWRNPCLHPGDVQILRAVNYTSLHSWRNVVIFPTNNCKQNIPLACSGGDLDGDKFYVLWDKELIPPRKTQVAALPYHKFGCQQNLSNVHSLTLDVENEFLRNEQLAAFICDVFRNDLLGRIAHIHLALSDSQKLGARDPVCCNVAKAQSYAVDFPKTGIKPCVPEEALKLVREKGYPDFMEKGRKNSYPSRKALGYLFRRAQSFDFFSFNHKENGASAEANSFHLDPRLLLPGREQFRKEAYFFHHQYANVLKCLMIPYGLTSEGECLLGCAIRWNPFIRDHGKASKVLHSRMELIQHHFRGVFETLSSGRGKAERLRAASAWYEVSYSQTTSMKSFAIIIGDILANLLSRKEGMVMQLYDYEGRVGRSALHHCYYTMQPHILRWTQARQAVFEIVGHSIGSSAHLSNSNQDKGVSLASRGFCLYMFGSVAQGLCTEDSDVDVVLSTDKLSSLNMMIREACCLSRQDYQLLSPHDRQCLFLETFVTPALQQVSTSYDQIFDAHVPIVRAVVDSSTISSHNETSVSVDVSCNISGLLKTIWLQQLFLQDPGFYGAFFIITKWFREANLIGKKIDDTAKASLPDKSIAPGSSLCTRLFSTGECQALILYLLKDELRDTNDSCLERWRNQYRRHRSLKHFGTEFFNRVVGNDDSRGSFLSQQSSQRVGMLILRFFEQVNKKQGRDDNPSVSFEWPCPEDIITDGKHCGLPEFCTVNDGFPKSLRAVIDVNRLRILGMYCGPAHHCLLVCNNVKQFFDQAAGDGNVSKYTCRLPTSLSYRIGPATKFVSQHLSFASGCAVRIDCLSQGEGRMKLFAEGSRCSILKLRQELAELTRGTLHRCSNKRRASIYFMEESTGMWLLGCEDARVQIKFKDIGRARSDTSLLQHQRQKVNELSFCRSVNAAFTNDLRVKSNRIASFKGHSPEAGLLVDGKSIIDLRGTKYSVTMADKLAIRELETVFMRQVNKMPSVSSFSGVKLSVSFGNFVVVNKSRILPDTRRTLSLKEVHEGMQKAQRYRRRWDRRVPSQVTDEESTQHKQPNNNLKMVKLETSKASRKVERSTNSARQRQMTGIPTTFIPTFGVQLNKDDVKSTLMQKYELALDQCGYKCTHTERETIDVDKLQSLEYSIQIQVSKAYEVKTSFAETFKHQKSISQLIDMKERELNWVHFTLLGNGVLPDVRIRLSSTSPISSELRKSADMEQSPIYWEHVKGNSDDGDSAAFDEYRCMNLVPKFHTHVPRNQRQKINFVRRTVVMKEYQKEGLMSGVHAKVLYGFDYCKTPGRDDDCWRPCTFCTLKLVYQDPITSAECFDSKEVAFSVFHESQMLGNALADCGVSFGD